MIAIRDFVITIIAVLIAIDVHECAHAWAASELGDPTGRFLGRLTLNPIAHLDPVGTVMILLSSFTGFGIGWGKPVPVNPVRLRYGPRVGMALVAVAGPVTNLVTAMVFAIPLRLHLPMPFALHYVLFTLVGINIVIAVFNLIPLPPLDGFSVLMGILGSIKSRAARQLVGAIGRYEAQLPFVLLAIIVLGGALRVNLLGRVLGPPAQLLQRLIIG